MEHSEFEMCDRDAVGVFEYEAVDAELQGIVIVGTVMQVAYRKESTFAVAVGLFDSAVGSYQFT